MSDHGDTVRQRRLRYRAWHRGTKEMDLLLGTFADQTLAGMSAAELDMFERFLDMPDNDLFDQVSGKQEPDGAFAPFVTRLSAMSFVPADYT